MRARNNPILPISNITNNSILFFKIYLLDYWYVLVVFVVFRRKYTILFTNTMRTTFTLGSPSCDGGITPFGNRRIKGLWHLPDEYRRRMRPSSAKISQASVIGIMSRLKIFFSSLVKEPNTSLFGDADPCRSAPSTRGCKPPREGKLLAGSKSPDQVGTFLSIRRSSLVIGYELLHRKTKDQRPIAGGPWETRTPYLFIANEVFYQLN